MINYFLPFKYKGKETNYLIDMSGNIYSLYTNKFLKPATSACGRYKAGIIIDKQLRSFYVHTMVAMTFIGDIPEGYSVNHIDENKKNNCVNNLEIVTQGENAFLYLQNNLNALDKKYTDEFIEDICKEMKENKTHYLEIAKKYNMEARYVYHLVCGTKHRVRITQKYIPFPIECRQKEGHRIRPELNKPMETLVLQGKSNKEICRLLKLDINEQSNRLARIRRKVKISDFNPDGVSTSKPRNY